MRTEDIITLIQNSDHSFSLLDVCFLNVHNNLLGEFLNNCGNKESELNVIDKFGNSALYILSKNGNQKGVRLLLEKYRQSCITPIWSLSPYLVANDEIKQLLVDVGLIVDKHRSLTQRSTYHHCCSPICACLDNILFFPSPNEIYI